MADPKLVKALARTWFIGWRPGHTWETATQDHRDLLLKTAREFIARYRLVQLPEEPDGYITPADLRCVRDQTLPGAPHVTLWNRKNPGDSPVYIIPGDPQEVEP